MTEHGAKRAGGDGQIGGIGPSERSMTPEAPGSRSQLCGVPVHSKAVMVPANQRKQISVAAGEVKDRFVFYAKGVGEHLV